MRAVDQPHGEDGEHSPGIARPVIFNPFCPHVPHIQQPPSEKRRKRKNMPTYRDGNIVVRKDQGTVCARQLFVGRHILLLVCFLMHDATQTRRIFDLSAIKCEETALSCSGQTGKGSCHTHAQFGGETVDGAPVKPVACGIRREVFLPPKR